jgi:hypothetical protein
MTGDHVKDLADALKALLARLANDDGVEVKYHKTEPRLRFNLMTPDKLVIEVDYDINQTSEEYINGMLANILTTIEARRKERQESTIIIV